MNKRCHTILVLILSLFLYIVAGCGGFGVKSHDTGKIGNRGVVLPGFSISPFFGEQERTFRYFSDVRIYINAPAPDRFDPRKRIGLVLYALPNGNTIEQTAGKEMLSGDDWHFNIQHIAAQTRFLRRHNSEYNLVVVYLETSQKAWPAWKRDHPDHVALITGIADSLTAMFDDFDTFLVLSGHSGGGSFIFDCLDGWEQIPDRVERIAFLDSDYNYTDAYGAKLAQWLKGSKHRFLSVIAYNDSIALYEGKPVVSNTGGTWYRSWMMQRYIAGYFPMTVREDDRFIIAAAEKNRIQFLLKHNPDRKILHTVQVELNGFIQSMLSGTPLEGRDYTYFGERAYTDLIGGMTPDVSHIAIPQRKEGDPAGSAFMAQVAAMSVHDRDRAIVAALSHGNIPSFLRKMVRIEEQWPDAEGVMHTVAFEVMPDYLAVGADEDFCRVPMEPSAAQTIADRFHASLPTRKLVDSIYRHAGVRLAPVTYYPVGDANERVARFIAHNTAIESRRREAGAVDGTLIAGIKKDIVLGNQIADTKRPGNVLIYGWHDVDGDAIQPLTNIHIGSYVDYSHGVRLINAQIMLDGVPMHIAEILADPVLYSILSDEDAPMTATRYETDSISSLR